MCRSMSFHRENGSFQVKTVNFWPEIKLLFQFCLSQRQMHDLVRFGDPEQEGHQESLQRESAAA